MAVHDPKGERKALFDYRRNPRSVRPGDVLRVTFKNGDPFNGVALSIKLRGIDTSVLLRNELTRVGVEMSVKVFSPNVQSVEIVQRAARKARRARLYFMRYVFIPGILVQIVYEHCTNWFSFFTALASTTAAVSRIWWLLTCARSGHSWVVAVATIDRKTAWGVSISIYQHVLLFFSVNIHHVSINRGFLGPV